MKMKMKYNRDEAHYEARRGSNSCRTKTYVASDVVSTNMNKSRLNKSSLDAEKNQREYYSMKVEHYKQKITYRKQGNNDPIVSELGEYVKNEGKTI